MHHLIGAALKVFAAIGVVVMVAEFFQENEKLERLRLSEKEEYELGGLSDVDLVILYMPSPNLFDAFRKK